MFDADNLVTSKRDSLWPIAGLAILSLLSLVVTIWILTDFPREQRIIEQLMPHLPASDRPEANELAGGLRLQARMSFLLIANLIVSTVALTMLIRAYLSSQQSLRNVHVVAADILASLDQGVITTDQQAAILSINPRGRELLELPEDGTELAFRNLPPDHSPLQQMCREVLAKQQPIRDQAYVCHMHGVSRHIRAGCSLLRDHDGRNRGTVIHMRDATEKTLMEQRLRRMERYMGLGSLAAGLQHEIKNPLSALSLHVQLLQESLRQERMSETVQDSLAVLSTEVRRINDVLGSFRDFASVSQLNPTETDVRELIEKLVKLTRPQAKKQSVVIETEIPQTDIPDVMIDPVRIEQVILNLILNALAAMADGGRITIRLQSESDSVMIEVADTGCGIPEDLRDKVFDPYFTTRSTGTGMGLALSEKIVRQHEGTIDFTSGSDGTTFTITLPRVVNK